MTVRRASLVLIAVLLAGPIAIAEDESAPPRLEKVAITVAKPEGAHAYRVEGTVEGDSTFQVTRRLHVDQPESGGTRVRPVSVVVTGQAPVITVEYSEAGTRSESWSSAKLDGSEPQELSILRAPLRYLWAAAHLEAGRLILGFPTAKGVRAIYEGFAHQRPFPTPGPAPEDPLHYHLWSAVDADLAPAFALLPGTWAPDQTKTKMLTLVRPKNAPTLMEKATLTYLGTGAGGARFAFAASRRGMLLEDGTWTIRRTTTGTLTVDPQRGVVTSGALEGAAGWFTKEREEPLVEISHRATIEPAGAPAEATAQADQAGALFDRLREDPATLYQAVLQRTYETAKAKFLKLRPDAKLDDVTVRLWDDTVDIGELTIESRQLNESPLALAILEETGPPLVKLGLIDRKTLKDLKAMVPGGKAGLPWAAAFAVPSRNLLLFKADYATHVPMMAHELAHLASDRFGYLDKDRIGIGGKGKIDVAWADLDGALAAWALGEAEAELIEKAVENNATKPALLAMGLKAYLKKLKAPPPDRDLFRHVMFVLYEASPRVMSQVYVTGDTVEKTIARAWKSYSYQTKQILFPDAKVDRTVLYPRARALKGEGPIGATRLGSFSIQQGVARQLGGTWEVANEHAEALMDDVLVRFPTGMLWVSRWADNAKAEAFADLLEKEVRRVTILRRDDAHLVLTTGEIEGLDALVDRLTKPVR